MKKLKQYRLRMWLAFVLLASLLCAAGGYGSGHAQAQSNLDHKLSPDLRVHGAGGEQKGSFIVQLNGSSGALFETSLTRLGGRVQRRFSRLNAQAVTLPVKAVAALAARGDVRYISPDRAIEASGHLTTSTGTDAVRVQSSLLGIPTSTLDGAGIGIAILDSGVDAGHASFRGTLGLSRVVFSQDFTGEGRTDDPYGHGTHVASIAAGNDLVSNGAYTGIASAARIVNLRVLNSQGTGTVSGLLGALDWVLQNRALYNIRVVNLSLGTTAVENSLNDPLCVAVRRLVDAGVVVAAAAGNNGRDSQGNKIYGQIHSPGNELSAITVGASNTFSTNYRSDDRITSYSSRGPTRSFSTDAGGTRHYENLVKPDLVAPGNRIAAASAPNNRLLNDYPELEVDASLPAGQRMMYLNGSSMATPVVTGAAALLLQANSQLTPNLVKALLMMTAQPLAGFNHFEQGAGQINVEGAVRLAKLVRIDLSNSTPLGAPLLTSLAPPTPQTTLAGQTFLWSQGIMLRHGYATGTDLFTKYQKIYGTSGTLGDAVLIGNSTQEIDGTKMTTGIVLGANLLIADGTTLGMGSFFFDAGLLLWGGDLLSDGVMVGDGVLVGDGIMVGDGVLVGDTRVEAQTALIYGE